MNSIKIKVSVISTILVGIIALVGSFHTIYINLSPYVGNYFAITIPICVDIFVITSTIFSMLMIEINKPIASRLINYLSYIYMIGSLYFNIFKSFNSLPTLIAHSSIVLVWIASVEMLTSYYKGQHKLNFNVIKREKELKEYEHQRKLQLIDVQYKNKENNIFNNKQEVKRSIPIKSKAKIDYLEDKLEQSNNPTINTRELKLDKSVTDLLNLKI